eukprot:TRINITY_DN41326_c0_g1_i1.p1 TRINITY_DN41326_c0_g1~~TRINITY_DN41326_c0_g1_i1.p1  ORF type:complete len:360 (-),score=63.77 TRINITY_DN41326_c0_g1_i1:86-1165(-)
MRFSLPILLSRQARSNVEAPECSPAAASSLPLRSQERRHTHPKGSPLADGFLDDDEDGAFDAADELEKGLVEETVSAQLALQPRERSKGLRRCTILYKDQSEEFQLLSETGDLLLSAAQNFTAGQRRIDIFIDSDRDWLAGASPTSGSSPSDASPQRQKPAFVLNQGDYGDEWMLTTFRCELCRNRPRRTSCDFVGRGQQLAQIRHSKRKVHKAPVHHLSVHLPPLLSSGRTCVWCPLWTRRNLASGPLSPQQGSQSPSARSMSASVIDALPEDEDVALQVQSKLPIWDTEVESLVLNFQGRTVTSCPRNFVLRGEDDEDEEIVLQHARLSNNMWCLDYNHPLSPVQAFGIALSTVGWD